MSPDVYAEPNESHDTFGVCGAVKIADGIYSAVSEENSFRDKFEAQMYDGFAIDGAFVDAEFETMTSEAPHDLGHYF